jgi:hypothetical protein
MNLIDYIEKINAMKLIKTAYNQVTLSNMLYTLI